MLCPPASFAAQRGREAEGQQTKGPRGQVPRCQKNKGREADKNTVAGKEEGAKQKMRRPEKKGREAKKPQQNGGKWRRDARDITIRDANLIDRATRLCKTREDVRMNRHERGR